jgi:hypothetical protein
MKIKIILVTVLILVLGIGFFSMKKDGYREHQVKDFEKYYLPKKTKECLSKHGYSVENPSAKEKKECEDYVKEIWFEQKVLNGIND